MDFGMGLLPHGLVVATLLCWLLCLPAQHLTAFRLGLLCSSGAIILGFGLGYVPAPSLVLLPLFFLLFIGVANPIPGKPWLRTACIWVAGILAFALALHAFGWQRVILAESIDLGGDPFLWYANLDKPFAGAMVALLLILLGRPGRLFETPVRTWVWAAIPLGTLALAGLTYVLGASIDAKVSGTVLLFLLSNLFLTVFPEELFFRGLIQAYLPRGSATRNVFSVLIMATLFALTHYSPSLSGAYLLLVFLAGALYAAIYQASRSIPMAIAVHFLVNAISVLLFQYPIKVGVV